MDLPQKSVNITQIIPVCYKNFGKYRQASKKRKRKTTFEQGETPSNDWRETPHKANVRLLKGGARILQCEPQYVLSTYLRTAISWTVMARLSLVPM